MASPDTFGELGLSVIGLGAEYPPYDIKPNEVNKLAARYYPDTPG